MKDIRLLIEGEELDVNEGINIALTKQFKDLNSPTDIINDWSKTIDIPATRNNNNIFGRLFEPSRTQTSRYSAEGLIFPPGSGGQNREVLKYDEKRNRIIGDLRRGAEGEFNYIITIMYDEFRNGVYTASHTDFFRDLNGHSIRNGADYNATLTTPNVSSRDPATTILFPINTQFKKVIGSTIYEYNNVWIRLSVLSSTSNFFTYEFDLRRLDPGFYDISISFETFWDGPTEKFKFYNLVVKNYGVEKAIVEGVSEHLDLSGKYETGIYFDPFKRLNFELWVREKLFTTGYAKLIDSKKNINGNYYSLTLNGELGNIFNEAKKIVFKQHNILDDTSIDLEYKERYEIDTEQYYPAISLNREVISDAWNSHIYPDYELDTELIHSDNSLCKPTEILGFDADVSLNNLLDAKQSISDNYNFTKLADKINTQLPGSGDNYVGDGFTAEAYGEFRSYLQKPFIFFNKLFQMIAIKLKEITGYDVSFSDSWTYKENPFWSKLVVLLSKITEKGADIKYLVSFFGDLDNIVNTILGRESDKATMFMNYYKYPDEYRFVPLTVNNSQVDVPYSGITHTWSGSKYDNIASEANIGLPIGSAAGGEYEKLSNWVNLTAPLPRYWQSTVPTRFYNGIGYGANNYTGIAGQPGDSVFGVNKERGFMKYGPNIAFNVAPYDKTNTETIAANGTFKVDRNSILTLTRPIKLNYDLTWLTREDDTHKNGYISKYFIPSNPGDAENYMYAYYLNAPTKDTLLDEISTEDWTCRSIGHILVTAFWTDENGEAYRDADGNIKKYTTCFYNKEYPEDLNSKVRESSSKKRSISEDAIKCIKEHIIDGVSYKVDNWVAIDPGIYESNDDLIIPDPAPNINVKKFPTINNRNKDQDTKMNRISFTLPVDLSGFPIYRSDMRNNDTARLKFVAEINSFWNESTNSFGDQATGFISCRRSKGSSEALLTRLSRMFGRDEIVEVAIDKLGKTSPSDNEIRVDCDETKDLQWMQNRYAFATSFRINEENIYLANVGLTTGYNRSNAECSIDSFWNNTVKPFDVVSNYAKMFNMVFDVDSQNKKMTIRPISEYFRNYSIVDWTDKLDLSQDMVVKPLAFGYRNVLFNYDESSKLGFSKTYKENSGFMYGEKNLVTDYNFNYDTKKLFKGIKETITHTNNYYRFDDLMNKRQVITYGDDAYVCKQDDNKKSVDEFGQFALYRGCKPFMIEAEEVMPANYKPIIISDDNETQKTNNVYCYYDRHNIDEVPDIYSSAEEKAAKPYIRTKYRQVIDIFDWLSPKSNTEDQNDMPLITPMFSMPNLSYASNIKSELTNNTAEHNNVPYNNQIWGLYDLFWRDYINTLYSRNTKLVTCWLHLNNSDMDNFKFNQLVMIDGLLYMVDKIYDYDVLNSRTTKVDLISINSIDNYIKTRWNDFEDWFLGRGKKANITNTFSYDGYRKTVSVTGYDITFENSRLYLLCNGHSDNKFRIRTNAYVDILYKNGKTERINIGSPRINTVGGYVENNGSAFDVDSDVTNFLAVNQDLDVSISKENRTWYLFTILQTSMSCDLPAEAQSQVENMKYTVDFEVELIG